MSVEHRPLEQPATATDTDDRTQDARSETDGSEQPGRSAARAVSLSVQSHAHTSGSSSIPAQIERTHLRARIAALERELEARERQRQDLITHYERVLRAQRTDLEQRSQSRRSKMHPEHVFRSLFDRWR